MTELRLWTDKVWSSLVIHQEVLPRKNFASQEVVRKKDLTQRVILSPGFKKMNHKIDLEKLRNYRKPTYSHKGAAKELLTTVSRYTKKSSEVDFLDMVSMYYSITRTFGDNPQSMELHDFMKQNELGRFGDAQYNILKKYVEANLGD